MVGEEHLVHHTKAGETIKPWLMLGPSYEDSPPRSRD